MVGDLGNEFSVVGDDNDDGTSVSEFTHYSGNRDKVLVANTGCGLVEDVNFLVRSERCSNNQALALPTRSPRAVVTAACLAVFAAISASRLALHASFLW